MDTSHKARIFMHYKGRLPENDWQEKLKAARNLGEKLAIYNIIPNMSNLGSVYHSDTGFHKLRYGEGDIKITVGASLFNSHPYQGWGYDINIALRGPQILTRDRFDNIVDALGFPAEITPPSRIPQFYRIFGWDPAEIPNLRGWEIAKEVIEEHGAKLKKVRYSICKAPYNLLIRELEGRIVGPNGSILGCDDAEHFILPFNPKFSD